MSDLQYLVRQPKGIVENPPLLILLHGYGSNEQDLFSFAEELPDEFLIISAQAPLPMGSGSYAWYSINFDDKNGKFSDLKQAKDSIDKIAVFIDQIKTKFSTNASPYIHNYNKEKLSRRNLISRDCSIWGRWHQTWSSSFVEPYFFCFKHIV